MIIRITDGRTVDRPGSSRWWAAARESALRGRAPHGINQLILDPAVTHLDVFVTEVGDIWLWAEQFEGWITDGRKQLVGEPLESRASNAPHLSDESLRSFKHHGTRAPR